ncbi:MAG: hypothetical protein EBS99_15425 [Betaproteobacteria bacterium]|nr:hypothetical protein [Betaproteobacteria bacterium]
MTPTDRWISAIDASLRTLFAPAHAHRPCPTVPADDTQLAPHEREQAGALMRVNHVGEVCAQALYAAQAAGTRNPALRQHFEQAAREEADHLAWTAARLPPRSPSRPCGSRRCRSAASSVRTRTSATPTPWASGSRPPTAATRTPGSGVTTTESRFAPWRSPATPPAAPSSPT